MTDCENENQTIINANLRNETEHIARQITDLEKQIGDQNEKIKELRTQMVKSESRIKSLEDSHRLLREDITQLFKALTSGEDLFDVFTGIVETEGDESGGSQGF